jgi:hypothetical protein
MKWTVALLVVAMMTLQASGAARLFCSEFDQDRERAVSGASCHETENGNTTKQTGQKCSFACAAMCGMQIAGLPEVQFFVVAKIVTRGAATVFAVPGFEPTLDPPIPKFGFNFARI